MQDVHAVWKKPGDVTDVPQARLGYSNGDPGRNSRYLSDGAYIKLRSLTLAYTLPKSLIRKAKFDNVRIYLQGQNLLTFTKIRNVDPENTDANVWYYPVQSIYNFGINVQF